MLEILGFMVVAYGVARLLQTSGLFKEDMNQVFGLLGVVALIVLGILLQQQASSIGSLVP